MPAESTETGGGTAVDAKLLAQVKSVEEQRDLTGLPDQKIKVFISSICDKEKYNIVRAELKHAIEATNLADVYTFEDKDASTLPAGAHYKLALRDSDICIFLIDNKDGISPGVQAEIDTVKKYDIKALYYFCDENQKEKTALEQSLMGAHYAKIKTVHTFEQLSRDGARALINDIVTVYHYYCKGNIDLKTGEFDELCSVNVSETEMYQPFTIPKITLENLDKSKAYILKFLLGHPRRQFPGEKEKTGEFDDWGLQFLPVLFEGKSIKHFNAAMYLELLKAQQGDEYYQIVEIRWKAIQAYFAGDMQSCIENLNKALSMAKITNQPAWVIQDILVDLRNQCWQYSFINHQFHDDMSAQKELTESQEELYYPILDRVNKSLHKEYIDGLYKKKTTSPYSVTIGNNLDTYGSMFASIVVISMYNGSLTHILSIYEELKDLVFYLSCKYDDWNFKLNMYKLAVFNGNEKKIKGLQKAYPEILNKLTADEAVSVMEFCSNHPIEFQRLNSQYLAFGAVGYFLDDKSFAYYQKYIIENIKAWLTSDNAMIFAGQNIFQCLSNVAYRVSQDVLSEICCQFVDSECSYWYTELFRFIAKNIDLRKMRNESAQALVERINRLLDDEDERKQIGLAPDFLYMLRKQNTDLMKKLDEKIEKYFPTFYENSYKLETVEDKQKDLPVFVNKYVSYIEKTNEMQGNGVYFEYGVDVISTIRHILHEDEVVYSPEIMDRIISSVTDTLLFAQTNISTKLNAIKLLICIIIKYPEDYRRNQELYKQLFIQQEKIEVADFTIFTSNIDSISLKIGLQFLYLAMGKDVYSDILEFMPYIQNDIATTIAVTGLIAEYLNTADTVVLPKQVEAIILQNVLQWLRSEYSDIRWNAMRIFLTMSRNKENHGIMNRQLVAIFDSNNAYIKNLIVRNLSKLNGITEETKEYIMSKCKQDAHFVVRMVCAEMENKVGIQT